MVTSDRFSMVFFGEGRVMITFQWQIHFVDPDGRASISISVADNNVHCAMTNHERCTMSSTHSSLERLLFFILLLDGYIFFMDDYLIEE